MFSLYYHSCWLPAHMTPLCAHVTQLCAHVTPLSFILITRLDSSKTGVLSFLCSYLNYIARFVSLKNPFIVWSLYLTEPGTAPAIIIRWRDTTCVMSYGHVILLSSFPSSSLQLCRSDTPNPPPTRHFCQPMLFSCFLEIFIIHFPRIMSWSIFSGGLDYERVIRQSNWGT